MAAEQLLVTEGKDRGALLSVEADLLLGRHAPDVTGRLGGDPEISRRHARVARTVDRHLQIEDLGSANGTFVNGARIEAPRMLEVGDVVRVGRTVLEVTASSDAATELVLVVTAGSALGRRLSLRDPVVIGRGVVGEGDLRDDLVLSRRHARVARDANGQLTVEDLGSANGTFVNDERVEGRRALAVGDSLRVGTTTLQLTELGLAPSLPKAEAEPAAPAPAAAPVDEPVPAGPSTPAEPPARPAPAEPPARPAPAEPPARPAPAEPPALPAAELPLGSVFAGCRVEEVISHGDMGVVYRAEELALQRLVALKLILPDFSADDRFRERFRRESKIMAAIDHPNVIPVFDAGDERGVLFIMMRLVEGTDMRALIAAQGFLAPLRAARIVQQVGAALDAAHARGMLHRDVKPSNVLLARRDHVYLTDFGLAKKADSGEALTRHGTIIARAEYVAPEQILNQRVDARADIYALACLLFEALTGEPPFARQSGGGAVLAHVESPRPSPLDLRPDLPEEFGDVVRRGMATDPSERYPSAGDLGRAALVAAGGLRRARAESIVATGEAAPVPGEQPVPAAADGSAPAAVAVATTPGPDALRWAIAIAGLAVVAVGMVLALIGTSSL